jgi:hypothetical protein
MAGATFADGVVDGDVVSALFLFVAIKRPSISAAPINPYPSSSTNGRFKPDAGDATPLSAGANGAANGEAHFLHTIASSRFGDPHFVQNIPAS